MRKNMKKKLKRFMDTKNLKKHIFLEFMEMSSFFLIFIAITGIWYAFFDLGYGQLISNNDGSHLYHLFKYAVTHNLAWRDFSYHPFLHGGTDTWSQIGLSWFQILLLKLKAPSFVIVNSLILVSQTFLSFFFFKIMDYLSINRLKKFSSQILSIIMISVMVSFLPDLMWRYANGHILFLHGMITYFSLVFLFLGLKSQRISQSGIILAFIALTLSLPSNGQQLFVYFFYFSVPFLFFFKKKDWLTALKVCLISSLALLFSYVHFHSMLENFIFGKHLRMKFSGSDFIYSYVFQNFYDFLNNLWLEVDLFNKRDVFFQMHEVNYALGPGVLLTLVYFFFNRKAYKDFKKFIILSFFIFSVQIFFSHNIWPFNKLLSSLPMMSSFRVPGRVLLLTSLWSYGFLSFFFIKEFEVEKKTFIGMVLLIFSGLLLYVLKPYVSFFFIISFLCILFIFIARVSNLYVKRLAISFFLISYLSYGEHRLYPFFNEEKMNREVSLFRNKYQNKLASIDVTKLQRVGHQNGVLSYSSSFVHYNDLYDLSLPSFTGAHHVHSRLNFLMSYLSRTELTERSSLTLDDHPVMTKVLGHLYNIIFGIYPRYEESKIQPFFKQFVESRKSKRDFSFESKPTSYFYREHSRYHYENVLTRYFEFSQKNLNFKNFKTAGSFWFAEEIATFKDDLVLLESMLKDILHHSDSFKKKIYLSRYQSTYEDISSCHESNVDKFFFNPYQNKLSAEGRSVGPCFIILPLNFSAKMRLNQNYELGRANFLLTYIKVPSGEWTFDLSFDESVSVQDDILLKFFSLSLLGFLIFRMRGDILKA